MTAKEWLVPYARRNSTCRKLLTTLLMDDFLHWLLKLVVMLLDIGIKTDKRLSSEITQYQTNFLNGILMKCDGRCEGTNEPRMDI